MTTNLFDRRPDQAHWTRMNVGFSSPLWLPFLMAAGAGAAWWTYANWTKLAASPWTGDLQRRMSEDGGPAPAAAGRPEPPVKAALHDSLSVQGDAAAADASDAIDAAYAANLGPVPLPAKRASRKLPAGKKTASKQQAAKKTPVKKTPAKRIAAKKTPAKPTR